MIGIVVVEKTRTPIALLPIDNKRLVIDSQLVAMRYGGAQDIYVILHPEQAPMFTSLFAETVYTDFGIIPRVVSTRLTGWDRKAWALGEFNNNGVFISDAHAIIPPNTYERLMFDESRAGVRIGVDEYGSSVGMMLTRESAGYIAYKDSKALSEAAHIYGQSLISVNGKSLVDFEAYVNYIKDKA